MGFCTGCGQPDALCPGCRQDDPPHFCRYCGAWMAVRVAPTGWTATCKEHGTIEEVTS